MSNNVACIAERSACVIRVTRLGPNCEPLTGPTDGAILTAISTINLTGDVEEGTRFEPKDACGDIVYTAEDADIVKRYNITIDFWKTDFEAFELMTDGSLVIGKTGTDWAGKVIGVTAPGATTAHKNGVALEIWTKTATGTGPCGPPGTNPQFMRHVLPRVLLRPGDRTFENDTAVQSFVGTANSNVYWGEGPWGDWPAEDGMPGDSPWERFFDLSLPTGACGYVTPSSSSGS